MKTQESAYGGEGLDLVFDNRDWVVGIKNYKPANDLKNLKELERHNKTDEQFVLLEGSCILLAMAVDAIRRSKTEPVLPVILQSAWMLAYTLAASIEKSSIGKEFLSLEL